MTVYKHSCYKTALDELLLEKKQKFPTRYNYSRLAEACRIQKTYLSKVFNKDGDLSEDQLFLACQFLGLSKSEREFVELLHAYSRCQVLERKNELEKQLGRYKKRRMKTEQHIPTQEIVQEKDLSLYILDPNFQLVHMFLCVKSYARSSVKLAEQLGLKKDKLDYYLDHLEKLGVIEIKNTKIEVLKDHIHIPDSHPLFVVYRNAIRHKALERINQGSQKNYCFSSLFTCSEETREAIQFEFLKFLKKAKGLVDKSEDKGIYQMNFDLVSWG